jgi:tricorn protease-like protein
MRTLPLLGAISVATAVALSVAPAQERAEAGGAARGLAELPLKPTRNVRFTTDEGTWMSLDVSPDGRTIVFDLVGDIYTVPIAGGRATRITDGMAMDVQPRWSPDGRQLVFVSDRDGSDDVWVVDANGRNPRRCPIGEVDDRATE